MTDEKKHENKGFLKVAGTIGKKAKEMAASATKAVKDGSEKVVDKWEQYRSEQDRKKYRPVFKGDLNRENFSFPKVIRVVDYDKRTEAEVCSGAIGFEDCIENIKLLSIYTEALSILPIRFYPNATAGVYYVNPQNSETYIDIGDYFAYLKQERVAELRNIARLLGAKHFRVVIKEGNASEINTQYSSKNGWKVCQGIQRDIMQKTARDLSTSNSVSVADEFTFTDIRAPIRPQLTYFRDDSIVNSLIDMRMNEDNRGTLQSQTYSLQCSRSSGISIETATSLGTALKKLNYHTADTFISRASVENQSVFEYTIDF